MNERNASTRVSHVESCVVNNGDEVSYIARWVTRREESARFGNSVSHRLIVNPTRRLGSLNRNVRAAA